MKCPDCNGSGKSAFNEGIPHGLGCHVCGGMGTVGHTPTPDTIPVELTQDEVSWVLSLLAHRIKDEMSKLNFSVSVDEDHCRESNIRELEVLQAKLQWVRHVAKYG
jgi:hypothetical protein